MNSSAIPMPQKKMVKVSTTSGEADRKKSTASGVCFWKSLWNSHLFSGSCQCQQVNTSGLPSALSTCQAMCGLRADTSASPELSCWDGYPGGTPVKTNCPARLSGVGTEEWTTTRSTRGEEGGLELRVWADRLQMGTRAWEALDCLDEQEVGTSGHSSNSRADWRQTCGHGKD